MHAISILYYYYSNINIIIVSHDVHSSSGPGGE